MLFYVNRYFLTISNLGMGQNIFTNLIANREQPATICLQSDGLRSAVGGHKVVERRFQKA